MFKKLSAIFALTLSACGGDSTVHQIENPIEPTPTVEASPTPTPTASSYPLTLAHPDLPDPPEELRHYIVSGQSVAVRCDWTYFEIIANAEVNNISRGSATIQDLIDIYDPALKPAEAQAVLFVHGEQDAYQQTDPGVYVQKVEEYRQMIGLPFIFSTVGYDLPYPGNHDDIRAAVNAEAEVNENWIIGFNDAQFFPEADLLMPDGVHFKEEGCQLMMEYLTLALP